jgi:hypothetical protein
MDITLTAAESAELAELRDRYPSTFDCCMENTQDMGLAPHSPEEDREVLRQLRNLADADEAY